jgi:uncharacterized Zn-finger protein
MLNVGENLVPSGSSVIVPTTSRRQSKAVDDDLRATLNSYRARRTSLRTTVPNPEVIEPQVPAGRRLSARLNMDVPVARRFSDRTGSEIIDRLKQNTVASTQPSTLESSEQTAFSTFRATSYAEVPLQGAQGNQCHYCLKSFKYPSMLEQHLATHTGVKDHPCDDCGKSFTRAYTLKVHQRQHQNERPFSCAECPKQYAEIGKLNMHVKRVHEGQKPWVCAICDKRFPCMSQWSVHQRVHTGERPFACPLCPKTFSVNSSLQRHQTTHADNSGNTNQI